MQGGAKSVLVSMPLLCGRGVVMILLGLLGVESMVVVVVQLAPRNLVGIIAGCFRHFYSLHLAVYLPHLFELMLVVAVAMEGQHWKPL